MNATKSPANDPAPPSGDIELLLPWHAAGTLGRRDSKRVEEALARDPDLARRYELVREELGATIQLNETLGAPSAHAMETLFRKIDAEPARHGSASLGLATRVAGFLTSLSPRTLAWSAVAAIFAIVLQAGLITGVLIKEHAGGGYETASAPSATAAGSYAVIRFAPQANAADITKFLEDNKLTIAGGPSTGGLYRVRVAATGLPKAELTRIVKRLQENKTIEFIATAD